jgi:hypothetical protein
VCTAGKRLYLAHKFSPSVQCVSRPIHLVTQKDKMYTLMHDRMYLGTHPPTWEGACSVLQSP